MSPLQSSWNRGVVFETAIEIARRGHIDAPDKRGIDWLAGRLLFAGRLVERQDTLAIVGAAVAGRCLEEGGIGQDVDAVAHDGGGFLGIARRCPADRIRAGDVVVAGNVDGLIADDGTPVGSPGLAGVGKGSGLEPKRRTP